MATYIKWYAAKVLSETRLKEGAGGWVEWLAGRAQDFVDDGRDISLTLGPSLARGKGSALQGLFLLPALGAFAARNRAVAAGALALK